MSTHFSANQYEQEFAARRLQNWEIPKRFKECPSTLEGFTQPISNDQGHILPGIPRSTKSPWGEFVGTWDMKKPPLRTKTIKTNAMSTSLQKNTEPPARTPSPKEEVTADKARTPTPQQEEVQTPSPQEGKASPRPPSQSSQCKKSPSPVVAKTPEPAPPSPVKSPAQENNSPKNTVMFSDPA